VFRAVNANDDLLEVAHAGKFAPDDFECLAAEFVDVAG
jgi:hypothetical protein